MPVKSSQQNQENGLLLFASRRLLNDKNGQEDDMFVAFELGFSLDFLSSQIPD